LCVTERFKKQIEVALFVVFLSVLPLAAFVLVGPPFQGSQGPSEQQDPYWWPESRTISSIFLRFTSGRKTEPTFVYLYVNQENRMGGLWGVIGAMRTIDWLNFSEAQLNATHWRTQSRTPWGLRQADYTVRSENGSLELVVDTSYELNQTMDVLDWYWEQINHNGTDLNARLAFGLQDGSTVRMAWNVTTIPNVVWLWMKYREWTSAKERTIIFVLCQPCTILLQREHGNDVAPRMNVRNGSFRTVVRFDARCPVT
jgi:hypothetical protein